ncbi:MAG: 50S ribosomal protein L24 [Pseudomonadota bacterium]
MAAKLKKGDQVVVINGRDRGKTGEILQMQPAKSRCIVGGINRVKRHQRQTQTEQGGIIEKEAYIHLSNLALCDPEDNKPTRVGFRLDDDGNKVRYAKRSGKTIA